MSNINVKVNIYEKMGPTHNNQNSSGALKKGGRLKSPHREWDSRCFIHTWCSNYENVLRFLYPSPLREVPQNSHGSFSSELELLEENVDPYLTTLHQRCEPKFFWLLWSAILFYNIRKIIIYFKESALEYFPWNEGDTVFDRLTINSRANSFANSPNIRFHA